MSLLTPSLDLNTLTPDARQALLLELAKLLLDEERLAVAGQLAAQPRSLDELAAALPVKPAAISHHLRHLRQAGLAVSAGDERYALDSQRIEQLKRLLFSRGEEEAPAAGDDKVLANFVKGGRLTQIPAQPAKRLVILRWLAEQFEPGREYPEREVNDLLRPINEDYAALRRLLVDHGLLTREAGVYRRV